MAVTKNCVCGGVSKRNIWLKGSLVQMDRIHFRELLYRIVTVVSKCTSKL